MSDVSTPVVFFKVLRENGTVGAFLLLPNCFSKSPNFSVPLILKVKDDPTLYKDCNQIPSLSIESLLEYDLYLLFKIIS